MHAIRQKRTIIIVALIISVVIISANVLLWLNVEKMEKSRFEQNMQWASSIAKTSEAFLLNQESHYFYDVMKLMTENPAIVYVAVYINDRRVVDSGNREHDVDIVPKVRKTAEKDFTEMIHNANYYVQLPLKYQSEAQAILKTVFSMDDIEKSKRIIMISMNTTMAVLLLLIVMFVIVTRLYQKLQQAEKTKEVMITAISHDAMHNIQPVLNKITEFIDQGKGNFSKLAIINVMRNIKENINAINRVLENLRFNNMLAQGRVKLLKTQVDVQECIQFSLENYAQKSLEKNIGIINNADYQSHRVTADETMVSSVFSNLIDNALKYSESGTTITISCESDEKWVMVYIKDQGRGILREEQDRIFGTFVRIIDEAHPVKGSGLGLANARRMIRMNGGDIGVKESQPGAGTTFFMKLPLSV